MTPPPSPSASDVPLSTRVPREDVDRADRIAAQLATDPRIAAIGKPSRASIIRWAIKRGLDAIEAEVFATP